MQVVVRIKINKMYRIEIPHTINHAIAIFFRLGMWRAEVKTTLSGSQIFYFIYFLSFTLSVVLGAHTTVDKDECIFLTVISIICIVQGYRLWCILWERSAIFRMVNEIGTHHISDQKVFILINKKLKMFTKFTQYFMLLVFAAFIFALIEPIANGKRLFLNIVFPFDRSNSEIVFWMEFLFIAGAMFLSVISSLFTIIIWYLMQSVVLKYNILGKQFENVGVIKTDINGIETQLKVSLVEQQKCYLKDFITAIESYEQIDGYSTYLA